MSQNTRLNSRQVFVSSLLAQRALQTLFSNDFIRLSKNMPKYQQKDTDSLRTPLAREINSIAMASKNFDERTKSLKVFDANKWLVSTKLSGLIIEWFQNTGYRDYLLLSYEISVCVCERLVLERTGRSHSLDKILGLERA